MLNQCTFIGRTTADAKLRYTKESGNSVATFTIAVDRPYKDKNGKTPTDFIDIVAWRKLADICAEHVKKGMMVAVVSRQQKRSYEDKEGKNVWVTENHADNVQFLRWPKDREEKSLSEEAEAIF